MTGDISYDGANHARMTEIRAAKVAGIAADLPPLEVDADPGAELLVLGWGSSLRRDPRRRPPRAGQRARGGHRPPAPPAARSRATSARSCTATTACSCRR